MNTTVRSLSSYLILAAGMSYAAPLFGAPSAAVDIGLSPAGSFKAKTSDVKGTAQLKNGTVTASNIVVNLKTLKTGIALRDEHTLKHLEVDKYPTAVLVSATGKDGKGEGIIKVHGVDQKVTGTYVIKGSELEAEFPMKLSELKITGIKYMGVGVKDIVNLKIVVPLKK